MTAETIVWRGRELRRVPALSLKWACDTASVWALFTGREFRAQLHPTPSLASNGYGDTPRAALEDARERLIAGAKEYEP